MFTQIITPTEKKVTLEIPPEMIGHRVEITLADLEQNGNRQFNSVEEVLSHFNAVQIDTRGWKFNRDEANER